MNFRLTLQYDGTDFHGWQMQGDLRTVQGELTNALSQIDSRPVIVHGSGRTDAGVHALGQVASVNLQKQITAEKLRAAINGNVGKDLRAMAVETVSDEFHARYSALDKTYRYRIVNARVISPFLVRYAHHEARPLDAERMTEVARLFLGEHDWTAFSSAQSNSETKTRTVTAVDVSEHRDEGSRIVDVSITAEGFLRYMVRSIVGSLMAVGRGEMDKDLVQRAIEEGERSVVAATAPACGLTLMSVRY
ncbi:MAG TPA: tRNA pseudouridine(38-40) synthase TruA [Pyrinomonadaceae bacterium]|nr:tRNA pseudouridine(38-40) synthase TruA [Pyrinomonadaceae bacterium]